MIYSVGQLAIIKYSYCFPQFNGEVVEIVGPLASRPVCRSHSPTWESAKWADCYLVNIEGAKDMPLAAEPHQLKPLPGEYEPGDMHEIQHLLEWAPRVNKEPVPAE
jgi:hypothetical protein